MALIARDLRKSGDAQLRNIGQAMRDRTCGGCTVCCQGLKSVAGVMEAGTPCRHVCDTGCSIYKARPQPCVNYLCAWRAGAGKEQGRPDRGGAIVDLDVVTLRGAEKAVVTVRFSRPFSMLSVAAVVQDATRIGNTSHVGFVDPWTKPNASYALFEGSVLVSCALMVASRTGEAPWNRHPDDAIGVLIREYERIFGEDDA